MDENRIDCFNMILDSFLDEGGNENGEFIAWIKTLSWYEKNLVGAMLIERYYDESENRLYMFEDDAESVLNRYTLN
jgi:hypothetical protein